MTTDSAYYVEGVLRADRRVLARAITLIESSNHAHHELAGKVLEGLLPYTGKSVRLGITGVPGVGKSTFIESLGMFLVDNDKKVAVLAVDPSSSRSGGSIMADKTRMEKLSTRRDAFIRPSPSGATLGGVSRKTRETMLICEAAGFDVVIVETVGVGQNEITVSSMVDFFLVLMLAGAGDELQGIKRGVLELADALAINKADGDNLDRAMRAKRTYETAMHMLSPASPNWSPPVLVCSSLEDTGISEIWKAVMIHRDRLTESGEIAAMRKEQAVHWMKALVEDGIRDKFLKNEVVKKELSRLFVTVGEGKVTPTAAAEELLLLLDKIAFA